MLKGENEKVLGRIKDEFVGDIMKEFVGLRSKMYFYSIYIMMKKYLKKLKNVLSKEKSNWKNTKTVLKLHKLYYNFGRKKLWSWRVKTTVEWKNLY